MGILMQKWFFDKRQALLQPGDFELEARFCRASDWEFGR
jgi:hypothetical protein